MVFHSMEDILAKTSAFKKARWVAVAGAENDHVVEAVLKAQKDGFVEPILVGRKNAIQALVEAKGGKLADDRYIDVPDNDGNKIAAEAVRMVREGKAQFLMKGLINTSEILKAILNKETGIEHGKVMTVMSMNEVPGMDKLVVFNDAGMIVYPTLEQKIEQIKLVSKMLRDLGYDEEIKVAAVCAAESVSPKINETVEAAELKKLCQEGEFPGCYVEGPISLDLALMEESAKVKGYNSPVAGKADVILFPNMVAGNLAAKMLLICKSGQNRTVSMILGAGVPVAMTSRAASAESKYCTLALAALSVKEA
ncbi:MAG: phosphate butyryltransferase [Firmicutes bacterium]|nr:phosphate butyryltransferase [Bacillota bacterium]